MRSERERGDGADSVEKTRLPLKPNLHWQRCNTTPQYDSAKRLAKPNIDVGTSSPMRAPYARCRSDFSFHRKALFRTGADAEFSAPLLTNRWRGNPTVNSVQPKQGASFAGEPPCFSFIRQVLLPVQSKKETRSAEMTTAPVKPGTGCRWNYGRARNYQGAGRWIGSHRPGSVAVGATHRQLLLPRGCGLTIAWNKRLPSPAGPPIIGDP
jgi:hypothetical protein